jgi:hypothetical protein
MRRAEIDNVSQTSATAGGAALLALAAVLFASPAGASVMAEPLETEAPRGAVGDERLASAALGCWDPHSWVWQAPRAERVALASRAAWDPATCEIGREGCARQPESALPEGGVNALSYETAALTCALKRAHHEQREGAEPFDAKSCLESQMTLWSVEDLPPPRRPRPFEGLLCSEQDPACVPMPPLPERAEAPVAPPPACRPWGLPASRVPVAATWRPQDLGEARAGHWRRVDRPPAV